MKKIITILFCIMALVFALSLTSFAASTTSNAYADTIDVVEGVPEPTVIDKNAKAVVKVNDTYYTIPTYYLIADNTHFTWSVHDNVKSALGLGSDVRSNLIRIQIPEGIKTSVESSQGAKKFEDATNLIEASFPTTMELVGEYFFNRCSSFTTVSGLENSKIQRIFRNTFNGTKLSAISLPSAITSIDAYAFAGTSITSVVIPDNVEVIGDHAFASCKSLATITISENSKLTTLSGSYHFEQTAISSFYFPSSLESLGDMGTFYKCTSLATLTNFENTGVTIIPERCFGYGPCFTSISFPKELETIGTNAFNGHKISGDIILPNTVETIGDHAFAGSNVKMGKLVLGAGVTSIVSNYTFEKTQFSEIYIPVGVTSIPQGAFNSTRSSGAVYYYTGTLSQLEALLANTNTSGNGYFTGAKIATLAEYNAATDKASKNYIVYDYSACDAFYNGIHNEADTVNGSACYLADCSRCNVEKKDISSDATHSLNTQYVYANGYMAAGQIISICQNANCVHGTEETAIVSALDALFNSLEYSVAEEGFGICVKYNVNKDALAVYKNSGKSISFGVVAVMADKVEGNGPLANNGELTTQKNVIAADVTADNIRAVTLRISGDENAWKDNANRAIYILGYATNGTDLEYLGTASGAQVDRNNITSVKSLVIGNFFNFNA